MATNISVPVKNYAALAAMDSIPLTYLQTIVGTLVERYRHTETITDVSSGTTASKINYKPLAFATEYRIFLTSSVGTVLLDGTINSLTWQGLAYAEVGDTLVHDASAGQTGHRLAPVHGADPIDPTIIVGRTEDNFMLIQGIALPDQAVLDVFITEYSGGAINERLWRQTSAPPHVVQIKGYFMNEPSAPPNLGYDGSYVTGLDGTSWIEDNEPYPAGAREDGTTEYWLRANATYNPLAARWIISNVDIFAPEGGVTVQYSTSDEGPWHTNQAAADTWRRWRDTSGFWHMEPLNELDDGWRFLTSFHWDGLSQPDPGVYGDWTKALSFPVDFDNWKHLLMELEWSSTSGSEFIIVPANILSSGPVATTGYTAGIGRVMHFRRNNQGASNDDSKYDAARTSTGSMLGFRYQFLHAAGESSNVASQVRIVVTGTHIVATLRFYIGR